MTLPDSYKTENIIKAVSELIVLNFNEIFYVLLGIMLSAFGFGMWFVTFKANLNSIPGMKTSIEGLKKSADKIIYFLNVKFPAFSRAGGSQRDSPRVLNERGKRIRAKINLCNPNLNHLIVLISDEMTPALSDDKKNPYDIELLSFQFVFNYVFTSSTMSDLKEICFSEGYPMTLAQEVIAIELRDYLLTQHKIVPSEKFNQDNKEY